MKKLTMSFKFKKSSKPVINFLLSVVTVLIIYATLCIGIGWYNSELNLFELIIIFKGDQGAIRALNLDVAEGEAVSEWLYLSRISIPTLTWISFITGLWTGFLINWFESKTEKSNGTKEAV